MMTSGSPSGSTLFCSAIRGKATMIAGLAASYRMPMRLHNVSGLLLNLASQQFSAAIHNAPRMECSRGSDRSPAAKSNVPVIKDGKMKVHSAPGIGADLD
jgi:L-alanine-DL-glutamate epimerase-like enolase superfamily enzyme